MTLSKQERKVLNYLSTLRTCDTMKRSYNPKSIVMLARRHGITHIEHHPTESFIRLKRMRGGSLEIIDVWYTTGTVGTTIDHPKQGRNTLFRKGVSIGLLNRILERPRIHTFRGYRRKY